MKFTEKYTVVFDLEATCPDEINTIGRSNIIEIGAVKFNLQTLSVEPDSKFSMLVKPRDYSITDRITQITNITNEMVENSPYFDEAIQLFSEWCGPRNKFFLSAWGTYYDIPLLRKECEAFSVDYGPRFVGGGLDVKSLARVWCAKNKFNTSKLGVEACLTKMNIDVVSHGLQFHRAADDALATGLILEKCLRES